MKTIIYIVILFLLPALSSGQENLVIRGQVIDATTNEPLKDGHAYVSCKHFGTITDEEGNFYLEVPTCCMTHCLIVSYMGYERFVIPVHDVIRGKMNIRLEPGVIALAELIFTPEYYRVIYPPEFQPFQPEDLDELKANDEYIEAMTKGKMTRLLTMF